MLARRHPGLGLGLKTTRTQDPGFLGAWRSSLGRVIYLCYESLWMCRRRGKANRNWSVTCCLSQLRPVFLAARQGGDDGQAPRQGGVVDGRTNHKMIKIILQNESEAGIVKMPLLRTRGVI